MVFNLLMQFLAEIPKPLESKSYTEFKMCILRLQRGEIKTLAIRDFVGLVDLLFNCLPYTLPTSYLHHVSLFLLLKKKHSNTEHVLVNSSQHFPLAKY